MRLALLLIAVSPMFFEFPVLASSPPEGFYNLVDQVSEFTHGNQSDVELSRGASLAEKLLREAPAYPNDWDYGNAIHKANLVLGRLALRNGALESAEAFLLEAGLTPGSPQLDTFGPNMTLARELLQAERADAVTRYFDEVEKFWEPEFARGPLAQWRQNIALHTEPDFGANLVY